jgi:hypothetical protein
VTHLSHQPIARIAVALSAAALLSLGTALPSLANGTAPQTSNVVVGAGPLGAGVSFADFVGINLNGSAQKRTTTLLLTNIIDSRGDGTGWNLTLQMQPFADTLAVIPRALPASSLTLTNSPAVTVMDETSGPVSALTVGPGLAALTAVDTGASIALITAPAAAGMGSYTVAPIQLTLNLPANTFAANYTTDALITIS